MSQEIEVGPLQIKVDGDDIWFQFNDPVSMMLEIPPSFEEQLRDVVDDNRASFEGKRVNMELANLPVISSRQLGMILTVREIMKPIGQLQLHNMSGSVKHLLQLTGTDRFFDI